MTTKDLPKKYVEEGLALAEGALFFGKRVADLTREELIAMAAHGWAAEKRAREARNDFTVWLPASRVARLEFSTTERFVPPTTPAVRSPRAPCEACGGS